MRLKQNTDVFGVEPPMLAGLPVIAPDFAPDIVGVLDEAGAGLLIDTGDPDVLADAMQSLINDPAMTQRLGENGRRAVFAKYHWERDAEVLIDAYHQLLGIPTLEPSASREAA